MKDTVAKESYVERWQREQKEKMGIPVRAESTETGTPAERGIPTVEGSPVTKGSPDDKNILGKQKEGRKHGTNARSEGQATPAE